MKNPKRNGPKIRIIFFDGVCMMCNGFVDVILKSDKKRLFKISCLQGEKAKIFLSSDDLEKMNSLILFTDKGLFYATDAFIEICKELSFPFSLGKYLNLFPKVFREFLYYKLAEKRYKLLGKRDVCRVPTQSEKDYFLP